LLRAHLFRLAEREHVMVVTVQHIVADGLSMALLLEELDEHYRAFTRQEAPRPRALAVQYPDFAVWQGRALADEGAHADQIAFWQRRLRGPLPVLELPADRLLLRDLELIASVGYTTAVWARMVGLLRAGLVRLDPVVTHRFAAAEYRAAFELMDRRDGIVAKVVLEHEAD
jgi:hypothetical protein